MTTSATAPYSAVQPAISRLGRFYITRELGRGRIGCVYLGHDPVIARDVALKTFNPRLNFTEKNRYAEEFINEARAAGRLSHPHIVTIYDACNEGSVTYVAMEYLQGEELERLLRRGKRFRPEEVASIAWKIADALDHAHRNEVIHRDIKPANIFMVGDSQPKLVDFGIARFPNRLGGNGVSEPGQAHTLFDDGGLLGTPNYMSPEQALGKPVDARTDVYSLGAVMYEMLVGCKPYHSESAERLLQMIANTLPPSPDKLEPQVPAALSAIVMKAMSKRPENRYDTAEKMALDIKRFLLQEKRAQRRMKLPISTLNPHREEERQPASGRPWVAWLALGTAAGIGLFALLR